MQRQRSQGQTPWPEQMRSGLVGLRHLSVSWRQLHLGPVNGGKHWQRPHWQTPLLLQRLRWESRSHAVLSHTWNNQGYDEHYDLVL